MARLKRRQKQQPGRKAQARRATVRIGSLGGFGDGLAEDGGTPLAVPFTAPGDLAEVSVEQQQKGRPTAHLIEVLEPGPERADPPCRHFGACGGCRVQHLAPTAYAAWKEGLWRTAFARVGIGGDVLEAAEVEPLHQVVPRTRRRARLAVRGRSFGFRAEGSHRIEPMSECHVLDPRLFAAARDVTDALPKLGAEAGEISLSLLDDGVEVILHGRVPLGYPALQGLADLADRLDLARLSYSESGGDPLPVAHRRKGVMRFAGVPVTVPPFGFLQATADGERVLREAVCRWLEPADRVADLYCGAGTFALPLAMARESRRVLAVDRDGPAMAALGEAAARPEVGSRLACRTEDLTAYPLEGKELKGLDGVVFDPPRAGARAQAEVLAASEVPNIVAVSCNPATFARDVSILLGGGYRLCAIVPLDQFLWTAHLEMAAYFQKA